MNFDTEDLDRQLVALAHDDSTASDLLRSRTLTASLAALQPRTPQPTPAHRPWAKPIRYGAIAAAVALVMLGGITFWPGGARHDGTNGQWWLGPPAAWAASVDAAIEQATANGATCRERTLIVDADGTAHESATTTTFYVSDDSYRRDLYDGQSLRETQWYTPTAGGMTQTSVRYDTESFTVLHHDGSFGQQDPIERLRSYVRMMTETDRRLGNDTIDGHECVGFEIPASRYGDNPDTWLDRIWFDVDTRLPVRLEQTGRPVTADGQKTFTKICDEFDYDPALPADTFTPQIPSGFTDAGLDTPET